MFEPVMYIEGHNGKNLHCGFISSAARGSTRREGFGGIADDPGGTGGITTDPSGGVGTVNRENVIPFRT